MKWLARVLTWLDVRLDSKHKNTGIEGNINIPVFMLRLKAYSLDPVKKYILYCDTEGCNSIAVYLLSERDRSGSVLFEGRFDRTRFIIWYRSSFQSD